MKPKYPGIYTITNKITGKMYIGQAINIYLRWIEHKCRLRNGYVGNDYLQKAWNKYGEQSFEFEVLEECPIHLLFSLEHYWVTTLNTRDERYGYNLRNTSNDGKSRLSDEARAKMSIARKGITFSQERNNKIRASKTGIPRDEETKRKLSLHWKGLYERGEAVNPMSGKSHSEATKQKIRENAINRPRESYKILIISDPDGNFIEEIPLVEGVRRFGPNIYYSIRRQRIFMGRRFKVVPRIKMVII